QGLPGEVHLAPVARPEAEEPERERVEPSLLDVRDEDHVAGRLRDLLPREPEEPPVHPDRHDRMPRVALRLRDLVLVVRELVVVAAGVYVEPLAKVLHGHRRTLDVPAAERRPPRAVPLPGALP